MKRKFVLITLALALVIGAALTGCSKPEAPSSPEAPATGGEQSGTPTVFNVGVKPDVPKFGYLDPQTNKYEGFEIDLSQAVAEKVAGGPAELKFTSVTPKTRGPLLDNGELDWICATFTITEERKLSFNFSDPYFVDAVRVMVKKDGGAKSFADLNGKTIGVAQAATSMKALQEEADRLGITISFAEFATYPEIKAALDSKRVDAFSVDGAILAGYLDDTTELLPEKLTPQDYGIATKLSNTELAGKIDDAIADMKADGSLDALLEKWGLN